MTIALLAAAPVQAAPELLPDLVAEPPAYPTPVQVERLADGQNHLLVRFDGWIHNIGAGPLEIRGSQPVNGDMKVTAQRIYRTDSSFRDDTSRHPPLHFENTDGHRHWHLAGAARYTLWDEAGGARLAPAAKVGFCLLDSEHVDGFGPSSKVYSRSATGYCAEGQPNISSVYQGISRGWRDYYPGDFPFQWVDVSDVVPGRYRLGGEVDPDNFVLESNEANNGPALGPPIVTVPGYAASPVTAAGTQPQTISLSGLNYGARGSPVFRIESAPGNGTLSATAGATLPAPQVTYTPRRGFAGNDTFVFSVRDSSSPFPIHASAAAVTVTVPSTASRKGRPGLLTNLRFRRHGRFLRVRARAKRSGVLRIVIKKHKRRLGSCRIRVRAERRFTCRIKLRRHASLTRARAVVSLNVNGKRAAVASYRVPRRLR
jgi:lysyl oxidase/Big-like domain-containing protein